MLGKSISKNSVILAAFAAATAALIALTFQGTQAKITASVRAAQQKALFEIVPRARHDNDLLHDVITLRADHASVLGVEPGTEIHVAKYQGEVVAYIIPAVAPDGYSGDINMIVGVNHDGTIAGVRVLSHKETPGLGDRVELAKSDWILEFNGKSLQSPKPERWAVKKDGGAFDAFTGATITPRAVVGKVKDVLDFYHNQQQTLQMGGTH